MNHEVVDNYIKMIKKEISSIYSADEFLSSMREYLDDYCDEHPGCTTEDLEEEFGTPEEIANEFIAVVLVVVLIAVIAFYRDVLSQSTQAKATDVIVIYPEEEVENPVW